VNSIGDSAQRDDVINHIAAQWGKIDPKGAKSWLASLGKPMPISF
jgi:hypothetical protein